MLHYNPEHAPPPQQWLELDELERIHLAEEYHRASRIQLPNLQVHAVFHTLVENQIAENFDYVVCAMNRLAAEGLSRHDCIHAVASVLTEQIYNTSAGEKTTSYPAALERLTAKSWREG